MPLENVQEQEKSFQNTQQYANSYVHIFSLYLVYSKAILASELYIYRDALPHKNSP